MKAVTPKARDAYHPPAWLRALPKTKSRCSHPKMLAAQSRSLMNHRSDS